MSSDHFVICSTPNCLRLYATVDVPAMRSSLPFACQAKWILPAKYNISYSHVPSFHSWSRAVHHHGLAVWTVPVRTNLLGINAGPCPQRRYASRLEESPNSTLGKEQKAWFFTELENWQSYKMVGEAWINALAFMGLSVLSASFRSCGCPQSHGWGSLKQGKIAGMGFLRSGRKLQIRWAA